MLDWREMDWVLLDMDGTLLDLAFDDYYWLTVIPRTLAARRGTTVAAARETLLAHMDAVRGTLDWYCLDYWADLLGLDMHGLKDAHCNRIGLLPHTAVFLRWLERQHKHVALVTNAHRHSLDLKLRVTGIAGKIDTVVCSHDLGYAKEDLCFWSRLSDRIDWDPARSALIDDSVAVLTTAREFGVRQVIAVTRPSSEDAERRVDGFLNVSDLTDLLPTGWRA